MLRQLILLIFLLLSGCASESTVFELNGRTMGTSYQIKTVGTAVERAEVEQVLTRVDQTFSNWDANSEISRLNRNPSEDWISVSSALFKLLVQSQQLHQSTQGYFDPGLGQLIDLWGFGPKQVETPPDAKQVVQVLQSASIARLQLIEGRVKKPKSLQLNLSAIAKGYAIDQLALLLEGQGIAHFMIEIGGEVLGRGTRAGTPWQVGIEMPAGQLPKSIELRNQAVATSGDYRNYWQYQGQRYAHILDPHTGFPADSDIASVSVVSHSAALSDAYATAMQAMGSKKALQLAQQLGLQVVIVLNDQHQHQVLSRQ